MLKHVGLASTKKNNQASFPPKNPWKQVLEKAFHKNAKTCRADFHKKPTKQDGTHMTIHSQITIPTSIFPTAHTTISPAYIPPTVATTHSPSQLHLLYTQNSLNTHHKLLVHIHNYSHIQHHQSMQVHGHTRHHKPLHLQANKSSTTTSTCAIVVGT